MSAKISDLQQRVETLMTRAPAALRWQLAPVFADLVSVLRGQEERIAALETTVSGVINVKVTK